MAEASTTMNREQREISERLQLIFFPHAFERSRKLYGESPADESTSLFVHYTAAESALEIIRTRRWWMRSTNCTIDYREAHHGHQILLELDRDGQLNELWAAIEQCQPGAKQEATGAFNNHIDRLLTDTYIACVSEFEEKDAKHGRLSMWRSFSNGTPAVAIVFAIPWFIGASESLGISFSPVGYFDKSDIQAQLTQVVKGMLSELDYLKTIDRKLLIGTVISVLFAAIAGTKHEGFREEHEWRAIYYPHLAPKDSAMENEILSVRGVPQRIYKIPLDGQSPGLEGLNFVSLFDRLIIGPSQYPAALHKAFSSELTKIGVQNAAERIVISGIPIRT